MCRSHHPVQHGATNIEACRAQIIAQRAWRFGAADMQQRALVRCGPARGGLRQCSGVTVGVFHIGKSGLHRFLCGLRPYREDRDVALC